MSQTDEVVDYIAHFTSLRDMKLLAYSLLKSVVALIATSSATMITLNANGRVLNSVRLIGERYDTTCGQGSLSETQIALCKAVQSSGESQQHGYLDGCRVLIKSVFTCRSFSQFLICDLDTELDDNKHHTLAGILNIYNNFLTLLNDCQTDELTGLANRKTFDVAISSVFSEQNAAMENVDEERRIPKENENVDAYWLAIIDIDNFKRINDTFGHLYGDEILIVLAQIIRENFRFEDLQFRFGGEEFVILLKAQNRSVSQTILERFRYSVESYDFPNQQAITVSIGAVEFKQDVFHVTSIDYADQALYYSKKNGKNRVTFFEDMLAAGHARKTSVETGEVEFF